MRFPVVVLDSLRDSIEVPLLVSGIVSPSLHPDVVSTVALSQSTEWKFREEIEWSIDMEAKVFVDTLSLWALCFVKIDNLPFLVFTSVVWINTNLSSFFILGSNNI